MQIKNQNYAVYTYLYKNTNNLEKSTQYILKPIDTCKSSIITTFKFNFF